MSTTCIGVTPNLLSRNPNTSRKDERLVQLTWTDGRLGRPNMMTTLYKIYVKALQMRLQPVLMEVISFDQSAFLPMRFILDKLLLTQETLA